MEKFKFIEHTADIKFQAFGKDIEEVFKNSALALAGAMCSEKVENKIKKIVKVEGKDYENLLYNFLEEFLFLMDSEGFFLSKVDKIKVSENEIEAEVSGDDVKNYELETDVKAITYNEMFVKKEGEEFIAQVVLDV